MQIVTKQFGFMPFTYLKITYIICLSEMKLKKGFSVKVKLSFCVSVTVSRRDPRQTGHKPVCPHECGPNGLKIICAATLGSDFGCDLKGDFSGKEYYYA